MTAALALASTALVVWAAWEHRPAPARARRLRFVASEDSTPSVGQPLLAFGRSRRSHTAAPASVPRAQVERLGRKVRGLLGRPSDPSADRRLGRALLVGIPAALISAPLGLLVAGWWWFTPFLARRRAARRVDAALLAELPEVVDLFVPRWGPASPSPLPSRRSLDTTVDCSATHSRASPAKPASVVAWGTPLPVSPRCSVSGYGRSRRCSCPPSATASRWCRRSSAWPRRPVSSGAGPPRRARQRP